MDAQCLFLLTVENIKHHIIIYYKILNFDNFVKFKIAVSTHKILIKKGIPAIFSDTIIPVVDVHSHKTQFATWENFFYFRQFKCGKLSHTI